MDLSKDFWHSKWEVEQTGWDIGHVSTPIKIYVDQLEDKDIRILIPGAGNSYEGEYLFNNSFNNVTLLDYSDIQFENLLKRCPNYPRKNLVNKNFFEYTGEFDLILEQTFFSAIHPTERKKYVRKMHSLLKENGKLVGLLFDVNFDNPHPPYGGNEEEYTRLFSPFFTIKVLERAHNSIEPRQGSEVFIILEKKSI